MRLFKPWTPLLGLLRVGWENLTKTGKTPSLSYYELHTNSKEGQSKQVSALSLYFFIKLRRNMDNKRLFSIILVVFIDLLGFSLILPLLPYYAETFKASQTVTGILVASYALMQLIGAPILGRLSDRFGRRPVLLLSVFGTFLGFLLLGFANALCGYSLSAAFWMG